VTEVFAYDHPFQLFQKINNNTILKIKKGSSFKERGREGFPYLTVNERLLGLWEICFNIACKFRQQNTPRIHTIEKLHEQARVLWMKDTSYGRASTIVNQINKL